MGHEQASRRLNLYMHAPADFAGRVLPAFDGSDALERGRPPSGGDGSRLTTSIGATASSSAWHLRVKTACDCTPTGELHGISSVGQACPPRRSDKDRITEEGRGSGAEPRVLNRTGGADRAPSAGVVRHGVREVKHHQAEVDVFAVQLHVCG